MSVPHKQVPAAEPLAVPATPDPQSLDGPEPTDAGRQLQDVLPKVDELSRQVGGLDKLSDIIDSLKTLKE